METLEQQRRLAEPEGAASAAQQGQRSAGAASGELLRQPPLLMAQALRGRAMAQLIPVEVAIPLVARRELREHGHGLMQPADLGEQCLQRWRSAGQTGGQLPMNS